MPTSRALDSSALEPRRAPPGRWRTRNAWAGPHESEAGPRPRRAGGAARVVGLLALLALVEGWGRGGVGGAAFLLLLAVYSGGLARASGRLKSRSARATASPWVCVPLLLHAACGLLGASALVMAAFSMRSPAFDGIALPAALLGVLFGWCPAIVPFVRAPGRTRGPPDLLGGPDRPDPGAV
jgi:hypothetical protein